MPKIKDENLFRIYLKARELAERALICSYTPEREAYYAERMTTVEMAVVDLLKALEVVEKVDG